MECVCELVSSGSLPQQLTAEVKKLCSKKRQKLLTDARFSTEIAATKGLAMKADLGIPWNKLRVMRRYAHNSTPCK